MKDVQVTDMNISPPIAGHSTMSRSKETKRVPKGTYHGLDVSTAGWPKERELYGHGAPIVVRACCNDGYMAKGGRSSRYGIARYAKCKTPKLF